MGAEAEQRIGPIDVLRRFFPVVGWRRTARPGQRFAQAAHSPKKSSR